MPEDRGAGHALTGRDAHIAVIGSALADIRSTGTSVLLRGDPGTAALLKVAEAAARRAGLRVLRMTGAEAESGLPFAAPHQVLRPLLDETRGDRCRAVPTSLFVSPVATSRAIRSSWAVSASAPAAVASATPSAAPGAARHCRAHGAVRSPRKVRNAACSSSSVSARRPRGGAAGNRGPPAAGPHRGPTGRRPAPRTPSYPAAR